MSICEESGHLFLELRKGKCFYCGEPNPDIDLISRKELAEKVRGNCRDKVHNPTTSRRYEMDGSPIPNTFQRFICSRCSEVLQLIEGSGE
jgi:hypothetical protein